MRVLIAIALNLALLPAVASTVASAQEIIAINQSDSAALNEQPTLEDLSFDGGVGGGADLSGNGSMVQILQLQPTGSAIAGSAVSSRFSAASARR